jgi:hypothetical protein
MEQNKEQRSKSTQLDSTDFSIKLPRTHTGERTVSSNMMKEKLDIHRYNKET